MSGFALAASAALRLASLDLCADEYLLALAAPGEIASVSRLSHDPLETPLAARARRHPANDGRIEPLLRHRPDLLVATGSGHVGRDQITRRLGLRVLRLPDAETPADVAANLRRLAAALGDPARAAPFARRLQRLADTAPAAPPSAWWLGHGGQSLVPGSLGAQWMRLAGYDQRPLPGGRVTLEQLALTPPSVLLRSTYRRRQHSAGQAFLDHPLVRRTRARTVATDGRPWTCMGVPMLDEVERLRRATR